ncbi:MAG: pepsin/retropepsin-like aspartic protease family protein [Chitinophagaceae bacterium]
MFSVFRIIFISLLIFAHNAVSIDFVFASANSRPLRPLNNRITIDPGPMLLNDISDEPDILFDTSSLIVPFTRAGNLILVQAKADTLEGNFILDTGAPKLVLNATYFRDYQPVNDQAFNDQSGGVTGSVRDQGIIRINTFSIGPFKYYQTDADRINLGHIEDSKGVKILGLLGMQLFRRFEMIIDYEEGLLYLHRISKKEGSTYQNTMLNDASLYNTFSITFMDDKVLTYIDVAGKKLRFIIDTGAEANVLDSRLPDKVFENITITKRATLAGAGNTKIDAVYGNMRNMKMGQLALDSLPVLVTNLESMCKSYEQCLDGMLGFDFLSMHKIGFNFVTRRMYIWK